MPVTSKRVVIVGTGHVAFHLGKALSARGELSLTIMGRNAESAARLASELACGFTADFPAIPNDVDVVIIAVRDSAIEEVTAGIRCPSAVVAHTSGWIPMSALAHCSPHTGVFYPLQTLHRESAVDMSEVPLCIEGNNDHCLSLLLALAQSISTNTQVLSTEQRQAAHIAAVFASNFSNHMYTLAEDILSANGLALDLLKPLITRTASNVLAGNPGALQTGPARRNDIRVIHEHEKILNALSPALREVYASISASIVKRYSS